MQTRSEAVCARPIFVLLAVLLSLAGSPAMWSQASGGGFTYSSSDGVRRQYTSGGDVFSGELLAENSSSDVVPITAGAASGVVGVATSSAPTNGQSVSVGLLGAFQVSVDAPCTAGEFVGISASNSGYGHCSSVAGPSQVIGLAETSGSGSVTVLVDPLVSTSGPPIPGGSTTNAEFLFSNAGDISGQGVMSYDTTTGSVPRVDFTNQSGWDSPVLFRNAQAPAQNFTLFPVNTDGQFEIQQFAFGQLTALLNLDTDGHVFLYGNAGGGFATDINGNTCFAGGNLSGSPCSGANVYNIDGKMTKYWGQPLAGDGISAIVGVVDVGQTGNYGPSTIFTTNSNPNGFASGGLFRLDVYAVAVSGVPGSTIQLQVNYTDADYGVDSQNSGASASFAYGGNVLTYSFIINAYPGTAITLMTNTANAPVYVLHARLQAL